MSNRIPLLPVIVVLVPAFGCAARGTEPEARGPETADTATIEPSAAPERASSALTLKGGLKAVAQEGWIAEEPASSMRAAQFRLPGSGGGDDASFVVYYFGGGGGSVEANFERWRTQFADHDGPAEGVVARSEVDGMPVHDLALAGMYVAETSPGSGERVNHPGWAMRAAVVESPYGPYYLKLVGSMATVEAWTASYESFVQALRR